MKVQCFCAGNSKAWRKYAARRKTNTQATEAARLSHDLEAEKLAKAKIECTSQNMRGKRESN